MKRGFSKRLWSWRFKPTNASLETHLHDMIASLMLKVKGSPDASIGLLHILQKLSRLSDVLDRRVSCAVIGEVNSGKTTLVNLLLRRPELEVGHLPSDPAVTIVTRAPQQAWLKRELDVPINSSAVRTKIISGDVYGSIIERVDLFDCSGLGGPTSDDAASVTAALRSDIAIWCSAATQCWKENERRFWEKLPARVHRNSILAVTCAELIRSPDDKLRLAQRLERDASGYFCSIVFVSANEAVLALDQSGRIKSKSLYAVSGAHTLERELLDRVDAIQSSRIDKIRSCLVLLGHRAFLVSQGRASYDVWHRNVAKWRRYSRRLVHQMERGRIPVGSCLSDLRTSIENFYGTQGREPHNTFSIYRSVEDEVVALQNATIGALTMAASASTERDAAHLCTTLIDAFVDDFSKIQRRARDNHTQASVLSRKLFALASYGL